MRFKGIMLRPLAVFCFSYYILFCILRYAAAETKLFLTAAVFAIFAVLTVFRTLKGSGFTLTARSYIRAASALCLGALLASVMSFYAFDIYLASLEEKYCGESELVAVVEEVKSSSSFSTLYTVKTISINGETAKIRMSLNAYPGLQVGNVIRVSAEISPVYRSGTVGSDGEYLYSDGIRLTAQGENAEIIKYSNGGVRIFLSKLNTRLTNILCDGRAGENSGIAAALFLGNKSKLQPSVIRDFRRLGISHVLALSGMHLSIVCGAVSMLVKRFGAKSRRVLCALITVSYVILTGASPSVCRAGIMLLFMFAANSFGRSGDSFTNLGISVFLLSVTDPVGAGGISLQLSAAAVFAILLNMKRVEKIGASPGRARGMAAKAVLYIAESIKITMSVIMLTLPLMWLYFGYVSIIAPLTSLVFSMLASAILYVAPIALIAAPAAHFADIIFRIEGILCSITARFALKLSSLRGIIIPLDGAACALMCVLCCVAFIVFCASRGILRRLCAAVCALLIVFTCAYGAMSGSGKGVVAIVGVSSNSCDEIIVVSDGRSMVIDVGNGHKTAISKALCQAAIYTETEAVMLTHWHSSYPAALSDIFQSILVRYLLVPDEFDEDAQQRLKDVCLENNVIFEVYSSDTEISFGETKIHTYENKYIRRSKQPAVRVDVSAFDKCVTYLGASYSEACADMEIDPDATVWLGCHGPKYKQPCVLPEDFRGDIMAVGSAADAAPDEVMEVSAIVLRKSGAN